MPARAPSPRSAEPPVPAATAGPACSRCDDWCASMCHQQSSRARSPAMRPVDPRIVDRLNDALTFELSVVNQYFLHARMLDNWGFPKLGKVFYDLSIDEMRDADALISRVLFFEGHPNIQRLHAIRVGEDAEEMLRLALESEIAAVAQFNTSAQECHDVGD